MPDTRKKFYLTTPIYYVNARPHIGHAYTTIVADVVARRHRLLGDDTYFLTGTDEHGQKIERAAAAAGIPPQQYADQVSASFENLWKRMGITNNAFIRTTDPRHKQGVQKLFSDLFARGFIELRTYTGQYSVGEEMFVDGPPGTIGPDGKPTETVSEENFFFKLSEFQLPLINLIESNELQIQPESRRNEVLSFLRGNVSSAQPTPEAVILSEAKDPDGSNVTTAIEPFPTVNSPTLSAQGNPYIPGALKDLSISRSSFTWGVPVPEPAASEAKEKHVIYVWLDALANYMTAIGYGSDAPADLANFEHYWPADLHLVGKEIIRFHCVYWPAFLMAAGLRLPKSIVAHGWLLFEESKMSKSRGNIVRTETILDAFGTLKPKPIDGPGPEIGDEYWKHEQDLFAADVLRYFLLREIPFGQDGSFSFDAVIQRYNSDLANGYGNLVSRTLTLTQTSFPNGFEKIHSVRFSSASITDAILEVMDEWYVGEPEAGPQTLKSLDEYVADLFERNHFSLALSEISAFISQIDTHLSIHRPWKLAKLEGDEARQSLEFVLYTATEAIRYITALLYPFLPYATASVWQQLGLGSIEEAAARGELKNLTWGGLKPGTKLGQLSPIFPRADKGLAQIMTDMESPTEKSVSSASSALSSSPEPATSEPHAGPRTASLAEENPGAKVAGSHALTTERPGTPTHTEAAASGVFASTHNSQLTTHHSPQITIDDFAKVDLRVARIVVAERIPKADKLLRLEVDLGYEKRQILAGIAEHYAPETLIGRKVVIVANLAPRKMRGLESQGMIVAASIGPEGAPVLAGFLEDVELGARLK